MQRAEKSSDPVWPVLFTAILSLAAGVFFYRLVRPQESAPFLGLFAPFPVSLRGSQFAAWLGWFPTFSHTFSFSLFTWLSFGRRKPLFASLLWAAVNILFEAGQALPAEAIDRLPAVLNLRAYLSRGRFDPFDVAAAIGGAIIAYAVVRFIEEKQGHPGHPEPLEG